MQEFLDNPVYNALRTGNVHLAQGSDSAAYFDPAVSPFAGFSSDIETGFAELNALLPDDRTILYASRDFSPAQNGWLQIAHIAGSQFIYSSKNKFEVDPTALVPLQAEHALRMVALAKLTKPGPFDMRTLEFGNYHGIFQDEEFVAMTGRRLHVNNFMEVSAVCTHPEFAGRGYAGKLMKHQINSILDEGLTPFLHVRSDNPGAIGLYEKLGFELNGPMHFHFLRKARAQ